MGQCRGQVWGICCCAVGAVGALPLLLALQVALQVALLNVTLLNVMLLNVTLLNVTLLNVTLLNVALLHVTLRLEPAQILSKKPKCRLQQQHMTPRARLASFAVMHYH